MNEVTPKGVDAIDDMIPDYSVANYVGGGGAEQFKTVGRVMVEWFKLYCDLKPNERVLEVGCGIGRIAIPLTQYLKDGSYEGFDIVRHGIEWCQQKITPRYPNFNFFVTDVYNKYYHPEGTQVASEYVFPFVDDSFDFVFLTSVFTHMLPRDLEQYTAEIGRVLRPGGRCFCTAYIITEEARKQLNRGTSRIAFKAYPEGFWTNKPNSPEGALAYPEEYLTGNFKQCDLETTRIITGDWCKDEFAQDILIAHKPVPAI
jgi:SAM-dependent methyltransferase